MTNFFAELEKSGITDVIIQFEKKEDGTIQLFVAPKTIARENALKSVSPIRFVGTSQEIDLSFFGELNNYLVDIPGAKIETPKTEAKKIKAEAVKTEPKAVKEEPKQEHPISEKDAIQEATKDVPVAETPVGEVPEVIKQPKVDNIKPLKEFYDPMVKNKVDILPLKEELERLLGNCTEEELKKPYPKKVKLDLEIRERKEKNRLEAVAKLFKPKEEVSQENTSVEKTPIVAVTESKVVEEIEVKEEELVSNKTGIAEIPTAVSTPVTEVPSVPQAPVAPVAPMVPPVPVAPMAPPAPEPIKVQRFKQIEVTKLKMLVEDFSYEQYKASGWTDELLIDHNRAAYETTIEEVEISEEEYQSLKLNGAVNIENVAPQMPKLSYKFPTPFDAPENEE